MDKREGPFLRHRQYERCVGEAAHATRSVMEGRKAEGSKLNIRMGGQLDEATAQIDEVIKTEGRLHRKLVQLLNIAEDSIANKGGAGGLVAWSTREREMLNLIRVRTALWGQTFFGAIEASFDYGKGLRELLIGRENVNSDRGPGRESIDLCSRICSALERRYKPG